MHLFVKRTLAFCIDYLILAVYAGALLGITVLIVPAHKVLGPVSGQVVGFTSLTLPVFFYFYLFEKHRGATPGKRIMKLKVVGSKIFLRNFIKFLPWEIAHTGVHWMFYYDMLGVQAPAWEFALLLIPQAIVAIYLVSILITNGNNSLYDGIAETSVRAYPDGINVQSS